MQDKINNEEINATFDNPWLEVKWNNAKIKDEITIARDVFPIILFNQDCKRPRKRNSSMIGTRMTTANPVITNKKVSWDNFLKC